MHEVHIFLDFLTPSPLCLQKFCSVFLYIWGYVLTPFPLLCRRHMWKPPYLPDGSDRIPACHPSAIRALLSTAISQEINFPFLFAIKTAASQRASCIFPVGDPLEDPPSVTTGDGGKVPEGKSTFDVRRRREVCPKFN